MPNDSSGGAIADRPLGNGMAGRYREQAVRDSKDVDDQKKVVVIDSSGQEM